MGDFHVGSPAFNQEKFEEWIAYILKTKNATLLNTGDNLNCAIPGSKSDAIAEKWSVHDSMEYLTDALRPLADKDRLDLLIGGNHEARVYRATGIDPMRIVARELGVPHFEGAGYVVYEVGDQVYHFWVRHGTGNAPTSLQSIKRSSGAALADVYVTGHTHQQAVIKENQFTPDGRRNQTLVSSGSFTDYEQYAAERGYAPSHLGAPRIFLDGTRHDVHVSL